MIPIELIIIYTCIKARDKFQTTSAPNERGTATTPFRNDANPHEQRTQPPFPDKAQTPTTFARSFRRGNGTSSHSLVGLVGILVILAQQQPNDNNTSLLILLSLSFTMSTTQHLNALLSQPLTSSEQKVNCVSAVGVDDRPGMPPLGLTWRPFSHLCYRFSFYSSKS